MEAYLNHRNGPLASHESAHEALQELLNQRMPLWVARLADRPEDFAAIEEEISRACLQAADQLTAATLAQATQQPQAQQHFKKRKSKTRGRSAPIKPDQRPSD